MQKLDPNGQLVWAAQIGSTYPDQGHSICTDKYGNVYTTGFFSGSIDFDPTDVSVNISPIGSKDIFIQKLKSNDLEITGMVLDDQNQAINSGEVSLLQLKQGGGAENVKTSILDSNGTYYLNGVMGNSYLLKADVTDALPNSLPTYYPDVFFWDSSEVISLFSDTSLDIEIVYLPTPPTSSQGSGKIIGFLLEGNAYRGPSDPIDSVVIGMTRPDISGGVFMMDTTDQNGYFEFNHLPAGDYALFPDITGIPLDTTGWSNISITGSDTETITFLADSNMITVDSNASNYIVEHLSIIKIWPNPVYDQLSVSLSAPVKLVRVFDMKGSVVKVEAILTEKRIQIKTGALQKGIYILELRYADKLRMAKFLKH